MAVDFDLLVLAPAFDVFGEPMVYLPGAGPSLPFVGVWNDAYSDMKFEGDQPVEVTKTVVGCRASSFPRVPAENELIQARGQTYAIKIVRPDSHGHLNLHLHGPV